MFKRCRQIICGLCLVPMALFLAGCDVTAPKNSISEPDPELVFVRGYRSESDECQVIGESAFTADFLDDASALVACPTDSFAMKTLTAETGAQIVAQRSGFSLFSLPYR
jgi:starvation-inducible outer membrane lipoprotein